MIQLEGEFGKRVARRLQQERIIWLTTVDSHGTPQPRPVWFLWDEGSFLIFSQPDTAKIGHISNNPRVALNLDSDGRGGDIVVLTGQAELIEEGDYQHQLDAYQEKYQEGFKRIGKSAEEFFSNYSVAIRVNPQSLRGH